MGYSHFGTRRNSLVRYVISLLLRVLNSPAPRCRLAVVSTAIVSLFISLHQCLERAWSVHMYLHPKVNLILLSANCRFCQVKRCGLNYRYVRTSAQIFASIISSDKIVWPSLLHENKKTLGACCLAYLVGLKCLWFPNRVTFQKKVNFVSLTGDASIWLASDLSVRCPHVENKSGAWWYLDPHSGGR